MVALATSYASEGGKHICRRSKAPGNQFAVDGAHANDGDSTVCEKTVRSQNANLETNMNDPHIEALVYVVEHDDSIDYDNAAALHLDYPAFRLTVADREARFEMVEHSSTEEGARAAVQPFIDRWEFEASLRLRPGQFKLRYRQPIIIDRNPTPGHVTFIVHETILINDEISLRLSGKYPEPPSDNPLNIHDPDVKTMHTRLGGYWQGHEPLASMSYFCLTVLETRFGNRPKAAHACKVDPAILDKIGYLTAKKGGPQARKAEGTDSDLSSQETSFLTQAITQLVMRLAQVSAGANREIPLMTLSDLPALGG